MASDEIVKYHFMSSDGLTILSRLNIDHPVSGEKDSSRIAFLICVASFTNASDPWTCESSRNSALQLLEAFCHSVVSEDLSNLLSSVLRTCIKSAFASTKIPAITQQAQIAIDPLAVDPSASGEFEKNTRTWKYQDVYVVTVLGWIIGSLSLLDVSSYNIVCIMHS